MAVDIASTSLLDKHSKIHTDKRNLPVALDIEMENLKENNEEGEEEKQEKRRPILRHVLRPILLLMRVFGLYYSNSPNPVEGCSKKAYLNIGKVYAILINALIFGVFVYSIVGLFYVEDDNGYYMLAIPIVFRLKTTAQALYVLYICQQQTLWDFIMDLEEFLNEIVLCKCSMVENKFLNQLRRWLYIFVVFVLVCIGSSAFVNFYPNKELVMFNKETMLPVRSTDQYIFFIRIVVDVILLGGWFLPAALCGTLMQTLHYTFHEYYRYLEHQSKAGICVRSQVKCIRHKFIRLSRMCGTLDGMVSALLMISYLGDLTLVCVILRIAIYTFEGLYGRLFIFSWMLAPMFTLLYLSRNASQLYDKGQEMFDIVQFFNTDEVTLAVKMEFDMLLFHLSTEPVVMTIWKMIPLYRSIVISIFVSIITYFALIISLA